MEWIFISNDSQTPQYMNTLKNLIFPENKKFCSVIYLPDLDISRIINLLESIYVCNAYNTKLIIITINFECKKLVEQRKHEGVNYLIYNGYTEIRQDLNHLFEYIVYKFGNNEKFWVQLIGLDGLCMPTFASNAATNHNLAYSHNVVLPPNLIKDLYENTMRLEEFCLLVHSDMMKIIKNSCRLENVRYITLRKLTQQMRRQLVISWKRGEIQYKPLQGFWERDGMTKSEDSIKLIFIKIAKIIHNKLPHISLLQTTDFDKPGTQNHPLNSSALSFSFDKQNMSSMSVDAGGLSLPTSPQINGSFETRPICNNNSDRQQFLQLNIPLNFDNPPASKPIVQLPSQIKDFPPAFFSLPPPNYNFNSNVNFQSDIATQNVNNFDNRVNSNDDLETKIENESSSSLIENNIVPSLDIKSTHVQTKKSGFENDLLMHTKITSPPKKLGKSLSCKELLTKSKISSGVVTPLPVCKMLRSLNKEYLNTDSHHSKEIEFHNSEEYDVALKRMKTHFDKEYLSYQNFPKLHPNYKAYYKAFSEIYDASDRGKSKQYKEDLWIKYWAAKFYDIKRNDWKDKLNYLDMKFKDKINSSNLHSKPIFVSDKKEISSYSFNTAINVLEELSDKIGFLGITLKAMIDSYRKLPLNSKEAYSMFTEKENITFVNMVLEKVETMRLSATSDTLEMCQKVSKWIPKLLDEAKSKVTVLEQSCISINL